MPGWEMTHDSPAPREGEMDGCYTHMPPLHLKERSAAVPIMAVGIMQQ